MATMIFLTTLAITYSTRIMELLEYSDWFQTGYSFFAIVYSFLVFTIIIRPTRTSHKYALSLALAIFALRTSFFIQFAMESDWQFRIGNVMERLLITGNVVAFHTWGMWIRRS